MPIPEWERVGARDWPEDADNDPDNGWYENICYSCGLQFKGHKRRVQCRTCATQPNTSVNREPRNEPF